jgi:hypothetical protein
VALLPGEPKIQSLLFCKVPNHAINGEMTYPKINPNSKLPGELNLILTLIGEIKINPFESSCAKNESLHCK